MARDDGAHIGAAEHLAPAAPDRAVRRSRRAAARSEPADGASRGSFRAARGWRAPRRATRAARPAARRGAGPGTVESSVMSRSPSSSSTRSTGRIGSAECSSSSRERKAARSSWLPITQNTRVPSRAANGSTMRAQFGVGVGLAEVDEVAGEDDAVRHDAGCLDRLRARASAEPSHRRGRTAAIRPHAGGCRSDGAACARAPRTRRGACVLPFRRGRVLAPH